jgi:hypothetical protein
MITHPDFHFCAQKNAPPIGISDATRRNVFLISTLCSFQGAQSGNFSLGLRPLDRWLMRAKGLSSNNEPNPRPTT